MILCERGIRTFESTSRTTMDLGAVLALKDETHLPVFIDPTQCVTRARRIPPFIQAARQVGADGAVVHVAAPQTEPRRFDLTLDTLSQLLERTGGAS